MYSRRTSRAFSSGHTPPACSSFSTVNEEIYGSSAVERTVLDSSTPSLGSTSSAIPMRRAISRSTHRSVFASNNGSITFCCMTIWLYPTLTLPQSESFSKRVVSGKT